MSLGQPMSRFELRTCPKCGAVQESPGSTVCEQCGTDMRVASMQFPSQRPPSSPRVRIRFRAPAHLLRRSVRGLVVLAVLVVGLSFVPAVSARVPAMKKIAVTTRTELLRAEQSLARWVPWLKPSAQRPRRTSTSPTAPKAAPAKKPAATAQKSAPSRSAAVQAVTVKSTPIGVTVQLNARAVGKTPMTLRLAPGTYKVTFSRPGYLSVTRTITVKAGQAASLNVTLVKSSSAPAPAPVTTTPQPPPAREIRRGGSFRPPSRLAPLLCVPAGLVHPSVDGCICGRMSVYMN